MVQTTYNIGDVLFQYTNGQIQTATVVGVVIAPETEDYLVTTSESKSSQRVTLSQLFASLDTLADKIVSAEQEAFNTRIQAIKDNVAKALEDYESQSIPRAIEE